jgi:hypothetical protein
MKFRVKTTLKARSLSHLGGMISQGMYDTQSAGFPAELKEVLIAEAEDPRGYVECLDPEDIIEVMPAFKDVSKETLDDISSGEGKAEGSNTPPLGEQDGKAQSEQAAKAPSPISKPRKSTAKKINTVKK